MPQPVPLEELRRSCDADSLGFETTKSLEPLSDLPGQERAFDALSFGLAMERDGFNLFAIGSRSLDPHLVVKQYLDRVRTESDDERVRDWIFLNNFDDFRRPFLPWRF